MAIRDEFRERVVVELANARFRLSPVEMAELASRLCEKPLSQGVIVYYFTRAFPDIPLLDLQHAIGWVRVSEGGLSDEDFNRILAPWLLRDAGTAVK